jgi:hypothetical protein
MSTIPTLYQYRMLPTGNGGPWSDWYLCTAAKAEDCKQKPIRKDWKYEVRPLFAQSPDKAVEEFKEALHAHFDKFPIPTQLGIVAIMKHIEKVFKERTK